MALAEPVASRCSSIRPRSCAAPIGLTRWMLTSLLMRAGSSYLVRVRGRVRVGVGVGVGVGVRVRGRRVPLEVALLVLLAGLGVEEVAPAARLAGAHVAADGAKRDHDAARHVLAAVVARALDHRLRVGVAHAEALARAAVPEELAARGAVEARVAHDGALLGRAQG